LTPDRPNSTPILKAQLFATEDQHDDEKYPCQTQQDEKEPFRSPIKDPLIGLGFSTMFHDKTSSVVSSWGPDQEEYFETLISF
jgi:hypothetical protein